MPGAASFSESFFGRALSRANSSGATPRPTVASRNTSSRAAGWRIGMQTPSGARSRHAGVPGQLAGWGAHAGVPGQLAGWGAHAGVPGQLAGWGEDQTARRPLRPLLLVLLILSAFLALAGLASASAQSLSPGGPVDFGGVAVGNTSGVTTLVFSVPAGDVVTVGSITALTEGSPNKDFAVSGQTCVGTIAGPST